MGEYAENSPSLSDRVSFCHMSVCISLSKHTLGPKAFTHEEGVKLERDRKQGDKQGSHCSNSSTYRFCIHKLILFFFMRTPRNFTSVRPHQAWIPTGCQGMFSRTAQIAPVVKTMGTDSVRPFKDRRCLRWTETEYEKNSVSFLSFGKVLTTVLFHFTLFTGSKYHPPFSGQYCFEVINREHLEGESNPLARSLVFQRTSREQGARAWLRRLLNFIFILFFF